jgi:uncharacterized C2H2 Zn-finger protein
LYRYHRIFQCPRCKSLFENADNLESHTLEVQGCELNQEQPAEGITGNIEKKLRSRKKAHRGQSETERWREIYSILFPEEGVPSPCESNIPLALASQPNTAIRFCKETIC